MSLVTPENVASRGGWKVTPLGRLVKPVRMRPEHSLPEQVLPTPTAKPKGKLTKGAEPKKKKRTKEPPTRARRRTIDPLKYGSQQLKGAFLENAVVSSVDLKRLELVGDQDVERESGSSGLGWCNKK